VAQTNPALTLTRLSLRFRLREDAAKNPCQRGCGRHRRAGYATDPRVHPTPSGWEMTPPLGGDRNVNERK